MAQILLTLPDNSTRQYEAGVTAADVAADIASSLAKKAISATVDGQHFDLAWPKGELGGRGRANVLVWLGLWGQTL